jgi:hypothetical protein
VAILVRVHTNLSVIKEDTITATEQEVSENDNEKKKLTNCSLELEHCWSVCEEISQAAKYAKTYNSRYSLVVTHPTTNLPI